MTFRKISKKTWIVIAVILALIGIFVVNSRRNQPEYLAYQVESRDMQDVVELSGKLVSGSSATLRFPAGGLVTYLGAKEGDQVKKWSTLASIDTRQLQKVLEQKLNLYAIARGTFEQTQDDYEVERETGAVDQALRRILERNQFVLDNAVKDVEYQDLSLKLSRIYSPIEGILIQAPSIVSGSMVSATDTWVVVSPASLEFVADLDETDLGKVKVGQQVELTLDAYPDEVISSVVSKISFAPKETTTGTTYEVTIKVPEEKISLFRLGLNGTAAVVRDVKSQVNVLPSSALTFGSEGTFVYVEEGTSFVSKSVSTGIDYGGFVEITDGVEKGATVYAKKEK